MMLPFQNKQNSYLQAIYGPNQVINYVGHAEAVTVVQ